MSDALNRRTATDYPATGHSHGLYATTRITTTYDANGNPTAKTDSSGPVPVELHFAYDSRDQLTQVIRGPPDSGESLGRFDYNHAGLRIRHRDSARGDIDSLYDQHAVLEENTPQGAQIAHYRYGLKVHSVFLTAFQFNHSTQIPTSLQIWRFSKAQGVIHTQRHLLA